MIEALIAAAVAIALVMKSLLFVPPGRSAIVERLGRFHRVLPPGWNITIPFLERRTIVDPDALLPGWRGYGEAELRKKLVAAFYAQGAPGLSHPLDRTAGRQ